MGPYKSPPRWALSVLKKVCPDDLIEEVEGDLYEAYQWRSAERGNAYAHRQYIFEVLRCLRYYRINFQTQNNGLMLLKNYFKTGFRFLWKTRGYSSLNILGLALGIAVCWLAYIFVTDEYSFDSYHQNSDRIYRNTATIKSKDREDSFAGSSYIMGDEFGANIPEIAKSCRFKSGFGLLKEGSEYSNQGFHYTDPDFFQMFDTEFVVGQAGDFLQPNAVVISERMAERLDIGPDITNQQLTLRLGGEDVSFAINGIYRTFPLNSSIRPDILVPFSVWASRNERRTTIWFDINMNAFYLLIPEADAEETARKMTAHLRANEDFGEDEVFVGLQPLTDIHLNPHFSTGNGINARGDNQLVLIVSIVGMLCLLIACVNYSTFAVGNYIIRLREVAVRKVFGAQRKAVFKQFVAEAFISAFIGLLLAIGVIALLLPGFADYASKSYEFATIFNPQTLLGGLVILILVTLISGIYPALVLSGFSTVSGLKGKTKLGGKSIITKSMVTIQFGISIFLIAGTLSVNKQLHFLLDMDLGYSGENLVRIFGPMNNDDLMRRYKQDLLSVPGVTQVAIASGFNGTGLKLEDGSSMDVRHARIDPDYLDVMNIKLLKGRNFNPDMPTDFSNAMLVNQAFVDELGLETPIGHKTKFDYGQMNGSTIIGIVDNFYFRSPKGDVEPLVMYMSPQLTMYDHMVKINPNAEGVLQDMEAVYRKHFSPTPFNHTFVEDAIAADYELENNIRKMSKAGAVAAIFLTGLGLMGFVGTQIRQRMKEVSVRKVLGAEPGQILSLFSTRYLLLILIGFTLGMPVAFWLVKEWLAGYANSVGFTWDTGVITMLIILAVAGLTIVSQLYSAMFTNPVGYLKEE